MREGAAPVVVRGQQQREDMHMAGTAHRLTATLSADALAEGVVARQDRHVAGGHDDIHVRSATIWQGESHGHVRVFEGCYAHWCGRANTVVKTSRARPFFPAHHQLYRSSVPTYPIFLAPT